MPNVVISCELRDQLVAVTGKADLYGSDGRPVGVVKVFHGEYRVREWEPLPGERLGGWPGELHSEEQRPAYPRFDIGDELRTEMMRRGGYVALHDAAGRYIGKMMVTAPEPPLAELQAQRNTRAYTTDEVLAYARAKAGQPPRSD